MEESKTVYNKIKNSHQETTAFLSCNRVHTFPVQDRNDLSFLNLNQTTGKSVNTEKLSIASSTPVSSSSHPTFQPISTTPSGSLSPILPTPSSASLSPISTTLSFGFLLHQLQAPLLVFLLAQICLLVIFHLKI